MKLEDAIEKATQANVLAAHIENLKEIVKLSFEQFRDQLREIQECILQGDFRIAKVKLAHLQAANSAIIKAFTKDETENRLH
mgnify:FL=1